MPRKHEVTNPETQETYTCRQWAKKLEIDVATFLRRRKNWGVEDPRTFQKKQQVVIVKEPLSPLHISALKNNQKFCTNPKTGESLLANEWADRYGVPLIEFYQMMKRYGKDSLALYQHFEKRRSVA